MQLELTSQKFAEYKELVVYYTKNELRVSFVWQVNQKMILTLTASIMFWSLQQPVDDTDGSMSPADTSVTTSTPDESPAPSISGEDESSSLGGEFSNFSIDDAASDTTVSSLVDNEGSPVLE